MRRWKIEDRSRKSEDGRLKLILVVFSEFIIKRKELMRTKTSGLVIGLILLCSISLQSQDIKFGALAGIGITNAHVTDKPEVEAEALIYHPMLSYSFNLYVGYKSVIIYKLNTNHPCDAIFCRESR